jgi:hypothetical protein
MKLIVSIWCILFSTLVFGQDLAVRVSHSNLNPEVNEQFKLVYKLVLDGSGSVHINGQISVQHPTFSGFKVISQKAGRQGFSFGGFDMEMALHQYTVVLQATKKGTFTIDPVSFQVGGTSYRSEKITINVGASTAGKTTAPKKNSNLFGKIVLSRSSIYKGEHVVATSKIYSRYNRLSLNKSDFPIASGFWNEEIKSGKNGWPVKTENINGVMYNVYTIKKDLLYPQKTGKLKIPGFAATLVANRTIFNSGTEIPITSNSPTINVKPVDNAPTNFSGLVGSFSMTAEISKTELSADEGIDVTVKVKGKGNLQQLDSVSLRFPLDFDVYDPEKKEKITSSTSGLSGYKTFNFLGIPRSGGEFDIGPVELVYFDPKNKDFKTLKSDSWQVKVERPSGKAGQDILSADQKEVEVLSEGIRHIRETTDLIKQNDLFFGSRYFWALYFSPFLLFFAFTFIKKRQQTRPKDENLVRQKKAAKIAFNALKSANEKLLNGEGNAFNEALLNGLFNYLRHKLTMETAELSKVNIRSHLTAKGATSDLAERFITIIEQCEMSRYAPASETINEQLYIQGIDIIEKLENELVN